MSITSLEKILIVKKENENLEFKESRGSFSVLGKTKKGKENKQSIYAYCVAIGNSGGGKLIFGIKDEINLMTGKRDIVGTNAIQNLEQAQEQIYRALGSKIKIVELVEDNKKIQIVEIPRKPVADVFKFYGVPLMRNGEHLVSMDKDTLRDCLNEKQVDYSVEYCDDVRVEDLDVGAIERLKEKWSLKSGNTNYAKMSDNEVLEKLLLKDNDKITNACVLLLGNERLIARKFANSEFIVEWRSGDKTDADFRENIRKPFLLAYEKIWETVNARNVRTPFKQGFIEFDIWAYDEQSVREAVLNAFAHREYFNRSEPVFVKIDPNNFKIKSPGGFVSGVTEANVLFVEGRWRNRLLMEVLERIGLVERSGIGLDRIYETSIREGKGLPLIKNNENVTLSIPAKIQDINFVYFLEKISQEKQVSFNHVGDFLALQDIKESGSSDDRKRIDVFLKNHIIEKVGRTSGQRYLLSKKFYEFIDKKSEYTRKKWLSKEQQKQVLLNYFKQHKRGRMKHFRELFEGKLSRKQINVLLSDLRESEDIFFDGKPRSTSAFWRLR